jgi:hypothetical protein
MLRLRQCEANKSDLVQLKSLPFGTTIMIFTIYPYFLGNLWVFDDERTGLKEEPFIGPTSEMISKLIESKGIKNAEQGFTMQFGDEPFVGHDVELLWQRSDDPENSTQGNWYRGTIAGLEMDGWLCPALGLYFPTAPLRLFVKADPLPVDEFASCPYPSIGIDLDGCVDEAPIFFQLLTRYWPGKVFVLTFRQDRDQAIEDLAKLSIRYDELILVNSFDAKAQVIRETGIMTYFDDQPEMLKDIGPPVNVMLVRNEGNFDFADKRWMLSPHTGKLI